MRILLLWILTTFSVSALAAGGGTAGKWNIQGYYGIASLSPGDLTTIGNAQSPAYNAISTGTRYGGGIGYNFANGKWGVDLQYDVLTANNFKTVSGANWGWDIAMNNVNLGLDYFLVNKDSFGFRIGAAVAYPTYSHLTSNGSSKIEYDTDKSIGGNANIGLEWHLGRVVSLFIEGQYWYMKMTNPKTSSGTALNVSAGNAATVDLSGINGLAGLEFEL